MYLEDAARTGEKRDFAQVVAEATRQFLGVPARPQKPAALYTEVDLNVRAYISTLQGFNLSTYQTFTFL